MSKPGTIQRKRAEVSVHENREENQFAVQLVVFSDGVYEDRTDGLLLIVDAWIQLMLDQGLDPDAEFQKIRTNGRLN